MATNTSQNLTRTENSQIKKANSLNKLASRLLSSIDPSYTDQQLLSEQDAAFQKIIDRQLDIAKGVAGNQVVDFFASVRAEQQRGNKVGRPPKTLGIDTSDLFTQNVGDIFNYFQDVYKNRYMEVSDLKFISKFIPSLGEGVRIYVDSIVASDDVSETITRNLLIPTITEAAKLKTATDSIKQLEDEYDLQRKLRVAIKKTLVTGTFYVYHTSYQQLFEMYSQGVATGKITKDGSAMMMGNAREYSKVKIAAPPVKGRQTPANKPNVLGIAQEASVVTDLTSEPSLEAFGAATETYIEHGQLLKCNYLGTSAMESAMGEIQAMAESSPPFAARDLDKRNFAKEFKATLEQELPNIYFIDSPLPFDAMNDAQGVLSAGTEGFNEFFNLRKDVDESLDKVRQDMGLMVDTDAAIDPNHPTSHGQSFKGITGTYLKWIDYKYVIPIDVLNQRVGYYHIIATQKTKKNNGRGANKATEIGGILSSGSMSLFDQMDISEKRKEQAIQNIVDAISSAILDQFSVKFVKKNAAFRKVIAECLIANGLVDNDYMIQFIPADQMIEFKCNEDETGKGESILSEAMFPAHLLLSIVICKMLNYINKGGNRTIAHISSGRVNRSLSNQVNRVIRDLQAGNVTFTDLLSSSMVFSKVTRDSNIAMPKDQAGNRLVEFEVQEGQDIDLNTNYETMLERWCMIALGIPPTVMDYLSDVSVARKIVSDNMKVAGRVATLQTDMEKPITELYKALVENSDMSDEMKTAIQNGFQFKLPRPRILANQNNSEALNTAYQNAQLIANIIVGEDANEPDDMKLKKSIIEKIVRNESPYIQWDMIDGLVSQAKIDVKGEAVREAVDKKDSTDEMENPDDTVGGLPGF